MTDETPTTEQPAQPEEVRLSELWGQFYEEVLARMTYDTVSKADKQQYRLRAADIALTLLTIGVRLGGPR